MNSQPPQDDSERLTGARLALLSADGLAAWESFRQARDGHFHHLIMADLAVVHPELQRLRSSAHTFLELGSGVGLITILADLMGYEAYGIEIEPELVQVSRDLARAHGSRANFVEGSFVPPGVREDVELLDGEFLTVTEGADAYAELELEIADFDLVYVFPWPGEEDYLTELVRRGAGSRTRLLTYSGDGCELLEF